MRRRFLKGIIAGSLLLLLTAVVIGVLLYSGMLQINRPSLKQYPVRGVDVSHYQGEIDWQVLAEQDIRFAYVKATEGSSYADERFEANWLEGSMSGLRMGAYHFFSFDSSGEKQAEHFIHTVPAQENMLPPVLDVESYGKYKGIKKLEEGAIAEIRIWLEATEKAYAVAPIIYTMPELVQQLHEAFPENELWIRSVYAKPSKDIPWRFWQYTNRARLKGYSGTERFIDMNVFNGSESEFEHYGKHEAN